MGKYLNELVEEALNEGHFRFAIRFTWPRSADQDAQVRFNRYRNYAKETGIHDKSLQGYYLKGSDGSPTRMFVVIGLCDPKDQRGRYGLEKFCKLLMFDTEIQATFMHPVEAKELKQVH